MKEKLTYYWKHRKFKMMNFMKNFWNNILNINLYNEAILNFYEQDDITKKKYKKLLKELRKYKIKGIFDVFFPYIKFEKYFYISLKDFIYKRVKKLNLKKYKNYKIINNFYLDENIFNDFKRYFPLKEYLIDNNFIDYHHPKFEDDDMFYYIFLSFMKLDNKVLNFINALNNWGLNGIITKININKHIDHLYQNIYHFEKIDQFLFFNKGPNFLINKNNDLYFYEKVGDKDLKYAITSISSEIDVEEEDYYFIWLYIIPLILLLLLFTKHLYYLKNKNYGLSNWIMMEWKFNILISNNFFYSLKVYLEWIMRYFTSVEFKAFNKNFYTDLDQHHRLKTISKAEKEISLNSIYDYMYNYKYNSYYMFKYRAYPGSIHVIKLNNIMLMYIIYVLIYIYMNKNIYKYYKSKFYQYILLDTYYKEINSVFSSKELNNFNTNEYKYSLIIYLYYTINKSNIYIHYISEIKDRIKKLSRKWI